MEGKWTKGEWKSFNGRIESRGQYHDTVICRMEDIGEKEANSHLIESAPALFEALIKAKETIKALHGDVAWGLYQNSPEMKKINSAIAAALGKEG